MKYLNKKSLLLCIIGLLLNSFAARAQSMKQDQPLYTLAKTISIPGNKGHDYLYINPKTQKMYVTHGNRVDVINTKTNTYVGSVKGLGEVHGVAIDNKLNRGFVSDNKNRSVDVFNPKSLKLIRMVSLKGVDQDGTILDPFSGNVFVFEGDSHQVIEVNPKTLKTVKVIPLGGKPEFAVSNGKGLIFNNLEDINKIAVINVRKMKVEKKYDLGPCKAPSGLAFDKKDHRLFTGCRGNQGLTVLNSENGKIIQTLPIGKHVDAVKYDPQTHLIFVSCKNATTTIIKQKSADSYQVKQNLKTTLDAKTMALSHKTHDIYLSASQYRNNNDDLTIPNTFKVYVYTLNQQNSKN